MLIQTDICLMASFPGQPGKAGTRKVQSINQFILTFKNFRNGQC